ncbi:hypothetical protein A2Z22_03065 [Candidatus Woesebacteria bacterium RBG_16_34_12]|uniref:SH3b domain-containing protein n=1 Tax=Candidatus Woesebacteria bacterium RBG_16_34_12 TaxID=1802480 RepID=A0A1F7X6Y6_9BACT|nr:MAG: hypothetical protein A2Z22_03065 [Candidatus Woesebacteria bacterium RBG_16_34_12]
MRKTRVIILIIFLFIFIIASILFFIGYLKPKGAGIFIESQPPSSVIIDGEQLGRTPYKETRNPKEITLKLIPESFEKPLSTYETRISLVPGIETYIKREFGESEESSSGEVLSFEKIGGDESSLAIVTIPDSAQIAIDNTSKAFAPYKTSAISEGNHQIKVSLPGYLEKIVSIKTQKGYKLTALIKLSQDKEYVKGEEKAAEEEVVVEEEESKKTMIKIKETGVGFLRVRNEPSTLGEEIDRVEPGKMFVLIEEDEETGWFKIEYEEGKQGWITNQYAEKVEEGEDTDLEENEKVSVTPTKKS